MACVCRPNASPASLSLAPGMNSETGTVPANDVFRGSQCIGSCSGAASCTSECIV